MAVSMIDGGIILPDGSVIGQGLGSNTTMTFVQPTSPIGWTKLTTHNNKTLRIVNGSVGSGGSRSFTTTFVDSVSFNSDSGYAYIELDSNSGGIAGGNHFHTAAGPSVDFYLSGITLSSGSQSYVSSTSSIASSSTGGSASHFHTGASGDWHGHSLSATTNLNVKYIDIILATKD